MHVSASNMHVTCIKFRIGFMPLPASCEYMHNMTIIACVWLKIELYRTCSNYSNILIVRMASIEWQEVKTTLSRSLNSVATTCWTASKSGKVAQMQDRCSLAHRHWLHFNSI